MVQAGGESINLGGVSEEGIAHSMLPLLSLHSPFILTIYAGYSASIGTLGDSTFFLSTQFA